ncbi:hypothetical protein KIH27_05360 [Mycobacterium sp. M1]|uniref:Uncharacterized protein n=1 Tax=Mycolicibacter acidiphilus TaxID=2835306 RepID=A0ABS5RFE7_9MYCO|nr:hypothetical protein [Mycolicibacter acidiphilus]MBS9533015.1 hypothetical protein [Mycolicibacter acidiphilus]
MAADNFRFHDMDTGPAELAGQLPRNATYMGFRPGPDRPDYCIFMLEKPLQWILPAGFDESRFAPDGMVRTVPEFGRVASVPSVLAFTRLVGDRIDPSARKLPVGLAYILNWNLGQEAVVDFDKVHYAAVVHLSAQPDPGGAPTG